MPCIGSFTVACRNAAVSSLNIASVCDLDDALTVFVGAEELDVRVVDSLMYSAVHCCRTMQQHVRGGMG